MFFVETAMFQLSKSELFIRNLHFHVYWDCQMENIKAFGQYLHCTIDSPYKHVDLKQDTCKSFSYFPSLVFEILYLRSCSLPLPNCLVVFSSLSMDINELFGTRCCAHNYCCICKTRATHSFYFCT